MKIYLIILIPIITILIHLIIAFLRKYINSTNSLNSKIQSKKLSKSEISTINYMTQNNNLYNILIVEDDLVNRKILNAQLSAAKYNVITAKDGKSALKLVNNNALIDIILLDIILPDISGFDVCKAIRKVYTMYEKPIIMVTSKNYIKDLVNGFSVGANDFITKPYNIYELIARINSAISVKKMFEDNSSLKKINKLKSDLVDMAAHDLKSPLTLISGYANRILKNSLTDSPESINALKISKSSNKMLSILNKLLNNSKLESKVLRLEQIDIVNLIQNSIDYYSDMANEKEQKLNFLKANDILHIYSDRTSLITIFDNLITNAIKYSPIQSNITISLENFDNKIKISIKDMGNGFSKDEIENLFIKFFPFQNKPTQGENSTGLGLYIINDMINRINGKISVKSTLGVGSEFILIFQKE